MRALRADDETVGEKLEAVEGAKEEDDGEADGVLGGEAWVEMQEEGVRVVPVVKDREGAGFPPRAREVRFEIIATRQRGRRESSRVRKVNLWVTMAVRKTVGDADFSKEWMETAAMGELRQGLPLGAGQLERISEV